MCFSNTKIILNPVQEFGQGQWNGLVKVSALVCGRVLARFTHMLSKGLITGLSKGKGIGLGKGSVKVQTGGQAQMGTRVWT